MYHNSFRLGILFSSNFIALYGLKYEAEVQPTNVEQSQRHEMIKLTKL